MKNPLKRLHRPLSWLLALAFLAGLSVPLAWSEDTPSEDIPTFRLNALESHSLPPAMYGTWSIKATVLKSDAPEWFYMPVSNELWTLARDNNVVTLKNIVNNAAAAIEVDKVEGNTATFHHESKVNTNQIKVKETPTITVDGDHISGINHQVISTYHKGKLQNTYNLDIHVEGSRLSGAKVSFRDQEAEPPHFEVDPIQFQDH